MRPDSVVEPEIATDAGAGFEDRSVGVEVHLLVFYRAPEALREYVVAPAASAIYAEGDLLAVEDGGERRACQLRTLVAFEDCQHTVACQRFLERSDAEPCTQRDRHAPRRHAPGEPFYYGDEVDEAASHRHVLDVGGPDVVRSRQRQLAQQVRIDLVPRCCLRGVRPPAERLDPHALHLSRDMQPTHRRGFLPAQIAQHHAACERIEQVQLVDPTHDRQVGARQGSRQIVDAAVADAVLLRLTGQRQRMATVDHRFALGNRPAFPSAPAKNRSPASTRRSSRAAL